MTRLFKTFLNLLLLPVEAVTVILTPLLRFLGLNRTFGTMFLLPVGIIIAAVASFFSLGAALVVGLILFIVLMSKRRRKSKRL